MKRHPDEQLTGFNLLHGWCVNCGTVLRVFGSQVVWWGGDGAGPFCALSCMRRCGAQGDLPDYVKEMAGTPIPTAPTVTMTGYEYREGGAA